MKLVAKHGSLSMYRHHRCRCDACRTKWNEKSIQWKLARRAKKKRVMDAIFNTAI